MLQTDGLLFLVNLGRKEMASSAEMNVRPWGRGLRSPAPPVLTGLALVSLERNKGFPEQWVPLVPGVGAGHARGRQASRGRR